MSKNALKKKSATQASNYYALIHGFSEGFKVIVVESETEEIKPRLCFTSNNIAKFIKDFSKTFKSSYKAIIFNVFQTYNSAFPDNIQICDQLKEEVEKLKIPYSFISAEMYLPTMLLSTLKLESENDDIIFIPLLMATNILSYAFRRESDGYVNIRQRRVGIDEVGNEKEFRDAFYGNFMPKKILAHSNPPNSQMLKHLKKIVDPKKLTVIESSSPDNKDFIIETVKWLLDPKLNNKYFIKPRSIRRFYASVMDKNSIDDGVIVIDYNEELPLTRKHLFPRTISQLYLIHTKGEPSPTLHFYKTCAPEAADCHQYELNFSIDSNNFPKAAIKNAMIPEIENLPATLNKVMKNRNPVIGFFDNSSVICVFDEKLGGYKFLDSWNGVYGNDIFLNLKPEKPTLEYKQPSNTKSVITFNDICSFTASQPIPTLKNGLKLIKNSTTKSTLQFETSEGQQKFSTPSFLMAVILKEHYMAIKNETGIRHDYLGIHYFKNFEDRKKVEEGRNSVYHLEVLNTMQVKFEIQMLLQESCNMLRVQYSDEAYKAMSNVCQTLDDKRILILPTMFANM